MLALSSILVFVTTFVAAALAVLLAWFTLQRMGAQAIAENVSDHLTEEEPNPLLKNESLSSISLWANLLDRFDFVDIMHRQLAQADLAWSVGRLTSSMLLSGSVVLAFLVKLDGVPAWAAVLASAFASAVPYLYVLRRRARRFRKFEENFPDALDSLARALRAGHTFAAAMELLASECEPPVSTEIRKAAVEGNYGTSWDAALANLCQRMPLLEVSTFAAAVQLQTKTGGKLNEVLAKVAENIRESVALKGEVRALAAHGKLTGVVLTVLPAAISAVMAIVNPSYLAILLRHPYGKYMIASSLIALVTAHFVIRKIVDIRI